MCFLLGTYLDSDLTPYIRHLFVPNTAIILLCYSTTHHPFLRLSDCLPVLRSLHIQVLDELFTYPVHELAELPADAKAAYRDSILSTFLVVVEKKPRGSRKQMGHVLVAVKPVMDCIKAIYGPCRLVGGRRGRACPSTYINTRK